MVLDKIIVKSNFELFRAHTGDAGADIRCAEATTIKPLQRKLLQTSLFVDIPYGYVGFVMSRSGLAAKNGVFVLNSPGVIDHGYTGEVKVNLMNLGDSEFQVKVGDRIAQLIIQKIELPYIEHADDLTVTSERGAKGHGSTGV